MRISTKHILTFDGFLGAKFDILKPRWLPTAEAALAHIIGDQTEAAYRRGDALERRREMMEAWAAFIDRPIGERGEVLQLSRVN